MAILLVSSRRNVIYQPRLIGNTCLYINFCKTENTYLPICTIPCRFQLKWTLEAVKLWQLLFLFTRSVNYRNSFDYFLTVTCRMVCNDFKTILTSCTIWKLILWTLSSHIQLHMYEFTNSVSLLGSSRDTALHLGEEELRYESRQTTVQQNSSNLHKEV